MKQIQSIFLSLCHYLRSAHMAPSSAVVTFAHTGSHHLSPLRAEMLLEGCKVGCYSTSPLSKIYKW